ncbi:ion channel TACAN-like [Oppia nitens]|uniref:ion channel TACAN-like n=1 Tax=Oppia nitens TaxID=1686743 RepID=UPI0023DB32C0|nr:ion channel TACAN-like [Oppia nitens]
MSDNSATIETVRDEWKVLTDEYHTLEESHKSYVNSITEFTKLQNKCLKDINHQKYRLSQLRQSIKKCTTTTDEESQLRDDIVRQMDSRAAHVRDIRQSLPQPNGLYLNIVLGNINSTLLDSEQRFKYKEQYEMFKLVVTCVILVVSAMDLIFQSRVCDAILHFLLVWYHCTLTIRESILVVNGSRIKGWWRTLHFLTTILAGVMVVWPDGLIYNKFRVQFVCYICYSSFLQFLQYYYQYGCLYRLRALGERYDMDITIQGFHSWMWRGLGFLLPFLYFGYLFQFYNAYTLYNMYKYDPICVEWQVPVVAVLYFVIFLGNTMTTFLVIHQKLTGKSKVKPKLT